MNNDRVMGDELKKTGAGTLFTVFGELHIDLRVEDGRSMPPLQALGLVAIESATEPHRHGVRRGGLAITPSAPATLLGGAPRSPHRPRTVRVASHVTLGSPCAERRGAVRTIRLPSASVGACGCGKWRDVLVAVGECAAGGGAGGEHEVGSVEAAAGGAVDDDGVGLDAGVGVDEHHAARVGLEAAVAQAASTTSTGRSDRPSSVRWYS